MLIADILHFWSDGEKICHLIYLKELQPLQMKGVFLFFKKSYFEVDHVVYLNTC